MFWAAILTWREDRRREAEFERVMGEHGAALARVSVAYAPAGSLREDLEQEIALGVWEALPRWNETASLKTFLFRVAHNRCIDVMRKQRPETSQRGSCSPRSKRSCWSFRLRNARRSRSRSKG